MTRHFAVVVGVLLGIWLSASSWHAQESKPGRSPADEKEIIKSTPTKMSTASSVKFRKDLGLPLASLGTLGPRIDAARRGGDPVTLAHAASELAVAEKVSGKTASLTSKQLIAESAELASIRHQEAELSSVLEVSDQLKVAQSQLDSLKAQIAATQAQTKAEKQAFSANQEPTSKPRKLVVNNYTTQYVDIQVNGYLKGQVSPGSTQTFTIDQMWNPIVLKGFGDADETTFGPVVLKGDWNKRTWNINGDDAFPNDR